MALIHFIQNNDVLSHIHNFNQIEFLRISSLILILTKLNLIFLSTYFLLLSLISIQIFTLHLPIHSAYQCGHFIFLNKCHILSFFLVDEEIRLYFFEKIYVSPFNICMDDLEIVEYNAMYLEHKYDL